MKLKSLVSLGILAASVAAFAGPITFKIGAGAPTQQLAQVESFTDFETFTGRTDSVKGTITFDPATKKGSGAFMVDVSAIKTGLDLRDEHMRSPMWLDAEKYPQIAFKSTNVASMGNDKYKVTGAFTMHGVTKTLSTIATVKYMKSSATTQKAGFKGDVLQTKAAFEVKLSDFGIVIPAIAKGKVAPTVKISIVTYGQSGA